MKGAIMTGRRTLAALLAISALVLIPSTVAAAASEDESSDATTYMPMVARGFDAEVAEKNGFRIVTNEDGSQQSIPVTEKAAALLADGERLRAAAQGTDAARAGGDCGTSWLSGSKLANDTVGFTTGFQVYLAVYEHDWKVIATGFWTGGNWTTSGSGPVSGYKNWQSAIYNVVGPGIAGVPSYSSSAAAILVDGTVCYSTGPSFAFG
ncbi:hypothetical protein [Microbacterium sp.]|uniref:hypothetical protein n=1 Tax=Microbacterium sp. TaxID=51671 RepID=UPI0039E5BB65